MKKILFYICIVAAIFSSCKDEYKNTPPAPERPILEVGDVVAKFELKSLDAEDKRVVNMGDWVTYLDLSSGNPDERTWTLNGAKPAESSPELATTVMYPLPGKYDVTLSVVRNSDGQTDEVTMTDYLEVLYVPLTAGFQTSYPEEGGVVTIKTGDQITFTDNSTGLADGWDWDLPGGTPATSTEQSPTIQYKTAGIYDVTLTADRSLDGETDEDARTGYIVVNQRIVDVINTVCTDNEILVTYNEPMPTEIDANVADEFSIKINTSAGTTLTPEITAVESIDEYNIKLTFSNQMYSDDEVLLSYNPTGILKDATGLHNPEVLTDQPCSNGNNLWDTNIYGFESEQDSWSFTGDDGNFEITDERAYTGKYSMKLTSTSGSGWTGGTGSGSKTTLTPGTTYIMSWKVWRDPSSSHAALGPWLTWEGGAAQQQFWTSLNNGPNGEWYTITKEYTFTGSGESFFWIRVKDNNIIYVDNVTIVEKNPR